MVSFMLGTERRDGAQIARRSSEPVHESGARSGKELWALNVARRLFFCPRDGLWRGQKARWGRDGLGESLDAQSAFSHMDMYYTLP